jgi:integrase
MKEEFNEAKKPWHKKPPFGGLYRTRGSRFIYISMNYYKQRLRFPTDREDTEENWEVLGKLMEKVGEKIQKRTFRFAQTFYWLDEATKSHFSALEGNDYHPEPEHVMFGEYAAEWMRRKIPAFASVTKQRDFQEALESRILPFFGGMPFSRITAGEIDKFLDNLKRSDRTKLQTGGNNAGKPLSGKRIKNIYGPLPKVWMSACNDYNWSLRNPFLGVPEKLKELNDRRLQERERQTVLLGGDEEEADGTREVFLLEEWLRLTAEVDPHYHVVLGLLLLGLIGSELEALMRQNVKTGLLQIRCAVVRDKKGAQHLKFKPKNWYRKRDLPLTNNLSGLLDQAMAASVSEKVITFANGIELPANRFVLTMKDGSPFNYDSFAKTVWKKAMKNAGLTPRVPYASRHSLVQWALLLGVTKTRLVDLMGHSTKKTIDEVYGSYRQGLVEERERILDYLGEDFLALEELKTFFPERYRIRMSVDAP